MAASWDTWQETSVVDACAPLSQFYLFREPCQLHAGWRGLVTFNVMCWMFRLDWCPREAEGFGKLNSQIKRKESP